MTSSCMGYFEIGAISEAIVGMSVLPRLQKFGQYMLEFAEREEAYFLVASRTSVCTNLLT